MQEFIIEVMNQFGYLGIIFLITIENVFPPIPSEVILPFSGFMTTYSRLTVMGVAVFATVGSVLGAYILYYVGYFLSPDRMENLINGKPGKLLKLNMEDIRKSQERFATKGKTTVFFCRFVPIIRSLISIPAGMAKMEIVSFTLLTAAGSFIWNIVLAGLGAFAGASWEKISIYVKGYGTFGRIALCGIVIIVAGRQINKRRQRK